MAFIIISKSMIYWQNNTERAKSPVTKYLEWKWNWFTYYNKESKTNENYEFKDGIVLRIGSSITWWSDKHSSKIWSNEVIGKQKYEVKTSSKDKDGNKKVIELFNWYWSDNVVNWQVIDKWIKAEAKEAWAKYQQVISILDGDDIISIMLKWACLKEFSWAVNWLQLQSNKIEFDWYTDEKKWVTKYTVPHWKTGTSITSSENAKALEAVKLLDAYYQWVVAPLDTHTVEEEEDELF